jgi:hypothetical protein
MLNYLAVQHHCGVERSDHSNQWLIYELRTIEWFQLTKITTVEILCGCRVKDTISKAFSAFIYE